MGRGRSSCGISSRSSSCCSLRRSRSSSSSSSGGTLGYSCLASFERARGERESEYTYLSTLNKVGGDEITPFEKFMYIFHRIKCAKAIVSWLPAGWYVRSTCFGDGLSCTTTFQQNGW